MYDCPLDNAPGAPPPYLVPPISFIDYLIASDENPAFFDGPSTWGSWIWEMVNVKSTFYALAIIVNKQTHPA